MLLLINICGRASVSDKNRFCRSFLFIVRMMGVKIIIR